MMAKDSLIFEHRTVSSTKERAAPTALRNGIPRRRLTETLLPTAMEMVVVDPLRVRYGVLKTTTAGSSVTMRLRSSPETTPERIIGAHSSSLDVKLSMTN